MAQKVKNLPEMWETQVQPLGQEDPLEKGMFTHSSILAWRSPWTEESGRLFSSWVCKESDTTEQLTLSYFFLRTRCVREIEPTNYVKLKPLLPEVQFFFLTKCS